MCPAELSVSVFDDLKQVLGKLSPTDATPIEVKRRTHKLCAQYMGGAWKNIKPEDMQLKRFAGGMSNMLFQCGLPEGVTPIGKEPAKVLMRVYFNPKDKGILVAESVIFTLLSSQGLGPKLFGLFKGGRLEEFILSRALLSTELGLPNISPEIARRIANVHNIDVPILKDPDYIPDTLDKWLKLLGNTPSAKKPFDFADGSKQFNYSDAVPTSITYDQLKEEAALLRRCVFKSTSPVVFCHNDLQEGNILLPNADNPQGNATASPRLVLIDFEYASYNWRAFEFANHFIEYTMDYNHPTAPFYVVTNDRFPSDKKQAAFFNEYLSVDDPIKHITNTTDRAARAAAMIEETKAFIPVSHLVWGVWSLLQNEIAPIEFGFDLPDNLQSYGRDRIALYFETKHQLTALENGSEK